VSEPQDPYAGQPYQPPPGYHPGYPPPGYPGYPAQPGYPPPYPGYAGYPGYPTPPPLGPARPASVTAAAVLAFVAGGLLIMAGLALALGASLADSLDGTGRRHDFDHVELAIAGIANLVIAAVLIAGGSVVLGGTSRGRTMMMVGSTLLIIDSLYWLFRPDDPSNTFVTAVIFAALGVLAGAFVSTAAARTWLAARQAAARY
jgi:hypothetical protein